MTDAKAIDERVFERIDDAFFALDREWRFTFLNDRATEVLDVDREAVLGEVVWDEFEAAVGTRFQAEYERAMETQEPTSFEEYYPPLETWFEVNAYPGEDGLSVYFRDVTDRVERERELERYESIVETVQDGIYVVDDEGRFRMVNESYADMLGYSADELVGADVTTVVDESTAADAAALERELEESDRSSATMEATLRRADGERMEAEATFALLPDGDRVGVVRDVTERKERERKLEQFRALTRGARDVIVTVDATSTVRMVNPATEEVFGYAPEELVGESLTTLMPEDLREDHLDGIREYLETGERSLDWDYVELPGLTADGEEIPLGISFNEVEHDGERFFTGIVRDVTERKEREAELERVRDLLHRTERIADVGGWEIDVETMEVFWTDHLFDLLEVDYDEEPPLDEALDVYHEEDRPVVEEAVQAAIDDGEPFEVEARFLTPDDEVRWLRVQGVPSVEDGEVVILRGAAQDVTERKRFERRLVSLHRVSRDLLRARTEEEIAEVATEALHDILEAPSAWFFQHDPDRDVLEPAVVSDTPELIDVEIPALPTGEGSITGSVFESGATRNLADVTESPHYRDVEGVDVRGAVFTPVGAHGVLVAGSPETGAFDDQMRQLVDIVGTTAAAAFSRVERERTLRDQRDRLAALNDINSLVHGLAESMFGLSSRSDIEQLVCDRLAASDSYEFAWIGTVDEDREVRVNREAGVEGYLDDISIDVDDPPDSQGPTALAHRTGEVQVIQDVDEDPRYEPWRDRAREYGYRSSAAVPIVDGDGVEGTLNVYSARTNAFGDEERDALRRLGSIVAYALSSVERERKLQRERNRIEFMNRLLRHNLLNSLNVVKARLDLLDGRVDYEVSTHLETATDRTREMIEFVQTVREATKVIGHSDEQNLEPVDVGAVLETRVQRSRSSYPEARFHLESAPSVDVVADDLLGEVIDNLLVNAVQHNPDPNPTVWVDATVHDDRVVVSVADDGPGIPDEKKEAVFDREAKDFENPGSGFGLYLVKEIMESYGGDIDVEDNDPEGAVFRLTFRRP